ncbi:zinc finger CCCH domain-containing protein 19 [Tanacetum coccineum]
MPMNHEPLITRFSHVDDSVLYNDGCIKDCMEKNLEDDAVIAPEKDSIIAPPSTPPGNDLNIAAESGSSWIDYIGPLTSDEIDSDKRWSYRDPNGNIHGLFSLAQLRSWKDYFPSDLQIWSYYGNVKEAILLHNALSRPKKGMPVRSLFVSVDCSLLVWLSSAYLFFVYLRCCPCLRNKSVNDVVFNKEAHHLSFFDIPKDVERASSVVEGRVVVSIMRWLSFQGFLRCIQCGNLVTGFLFCGQSALFVRELCEFSTYSEYTLCLFALLLLWKDAYGSVSETNFVPTASPSKMMLSGKSLLF